MRTLNNFPINELSTLLDQPLPPQAYKALPGGAGLTDIDASWQRRAFNKIFGVYGLGWGFEFEAKDLELRHEEVVTAKGSRVTPFARVYGRFWIAVKNDAGEVSKISFPVTGANGNQTGNEGYSMKGAITNAIGFGASMIGWQESVYLGARSHSNTEGFAEGKGYSDVEPNEPAPAPAPAPAPVAKKAGYCKDCLLVIEEPALPSVCKCGSREIIASTSRKTAVDCVNKLKELKAKKSNPPANDPPTAGPDLPIEEPATEQPEDDKKSLAEKLGFQSIKHIVCVQCGWAEPVNSEPPACPSCGVVAEKAFSLCQSHDHMQQCSKNIKTKIELERSADNSKGILEEIKAGCKNDRRLILQSLSFAVGRTIKNYAECSPAEMQACLTNIKSGIWPTDGQSENKPAPAPDVPKDKAGLCKAVYGIADTLKLGTPRQVIAEIGKVAGKTISSAVQLNEAELLAVYENFKARLSA